MRRTYRTQVQFYADDPALTEVEWVFVPTDRPTLPVPSFVVSADWDQPNGPRSNVPPGYYGQQGEHLGSTRGFVHTVPLPWEAFNGHFCGTPSQWAGGLLIGNPADHGVAGCCGGFQAQQTLGCATAWREASANGQLCSVGLLGGEGLAAALATSSGGSASEGASLATATANGEADGTTPAGTWSATVSQTFTTAGTYTFTVPTGVTSMQIECWGAGASGSYARGSSIPPAHAGVGGGGGQYKRITATVTPGDTLTVVVGTGGVLTGPTTLGVSGTASSVSDSVPTVLCQANPGLGGNALLNTGGAGGAGGSGGVRFSGGNGGSGSTSSTGGSGGGASAGPAAPGGFGQSARAGGGAGGTAPTGGGAGGHGGAVNDNTNVTPGSPPGGGGGGGGTFGTLGMTGADGADGQVTLTW